MKKLSLLAIALLAGLPGCGCRKQQDAERLRREPIEQYMDAASADDMEEFEEDEEFDEDDNKNRMKRPGQDDMDDELTEEDIASFNFGDGDLDFDALETESYGDDYDDMMDAEMMGEGKSSFGWIDAQTDDEFRKLYFSFNHYGVRADQKDALNYDIEQIKQLLAESGATQPTVVIEGHACQEGTPAYNLALSEKRAKAVADLFVAAGVDRNVIKVVGRGQECPMVINGKVVNGSREEREPNRRVEVRVIYT